jgi:hypothetical protein
MRDFLEEVDGYIIAVEGESRRRVRAAGLKRRKRGEDSVRGGAFGKGIERIETAKISKMKT